MQLDEEKFNRDRAEKLSEILQHLAVDSSPRMISDALKLAFNEGVTYGLKLSGDLIFERQEKGPSEDDPCSDC